MGGATSKRSIPAIARSDSDDPSTLASQATPGWQSAEAPRREGGLEPCGACEASGEGSLRSQWRIDIRSHSRDSISPEV
jgi:hypothetical protein